MMAVSGFLLAAAHFHSFSLRRLFGVVVGIGLVIASACVFNNYIDRGIDQKMARTRRRATVTREISGQATLTFASLLGIGGFAVLAVTTNWRTVALNLIAIFSYVVLYGWAKRNSVHGTLVGTIPGAIPPVAGYVAVANRIDGGGLLLFLILVFWQMPHFYAIAMYRYKDYQAAGLPVMPVRYGMRATRIQIFAYIATLAIALIGLTVFGYDGYVFLAASIILCAYWAQTGYSGRSLADKEWGKRMFLASLIVLTTLSVLIPLGSLLP